MSPTARCLSNNILYQANITPVDENSETKVYYGICETTFKLRYTNHKKPFNHRNRVLENKRQQTQLKHNMGDFR